VPRVSVILPTYNRAQYIEESIRSVLDQTYTDFELIVVDDASTDQTSQIVNAMNDDRVRYVRHEQNQGPAVARNMGIEHSRGDYLTFQDDDDTWVKHKLQRQVDLLDSYSNRLGLVYTGATNINDEREVYVPSDKLEKREKNVYPHILFGMFVNIHCMIRQECLELVGKFDTEFDRFQDWELWVRIAKHYNVHLIDEKLVYWRKMADKQRTLDDSVYRNSLLGIVKKHREDILRHGKKLLGDCYDRPAYIWGAGMGGRHFKGMTEPLEFEFTGFIDNDPDKQGRSIDGLTVLSPDEFVRKISRSSSAPNIIVKSLHANEIVSEMNAMDVELDYRVL